MQIRFRCRHNTDTDIVIDTYIDTVTMISKGIVRDAAIDRQLIKQRTLSQSSFFNASVRYSSSKVFYLRQSQSQLAPACLWTPFV